MNTKDRPIDVSSSQTIYGASDIAGILEVSKPVFSNWLSRIDGTPPPTYITPNGKLFWDSDGLASWWTWRNERVAAERERLTRTAADAQKRLDRARERLNQS